MKRSGATARWQFALLLPFAALLFPAFYARGEPAFDHVPFFYWYQFAWLIASALVTAFVYRRTR